MRTELVSPPLTTKVLDHQTHFYWSFVHAHMHAFFRQAPKETNADSQGKPVVVCLVLSRACGFDFLPVRARTFFIWETSTVCFLPFLEE